MTRVLRSDVSDREPGLSCAVLDTVLQPSERPRAEATVRPLAVVKTLTDVREVFQHNDRLLELLGVFECLPRSLLDDVCECFLVVVEPLVNLPLSGVTLLEARERREHLFTEVTSATTSNDTVGCN